MLMPAIRFTFKESWPSTLSIAQNPAVSDCNVTFIGEMEGARLGYSLASGDVEIRIEVDEGAPAPR